MPRTGARQIYGEFLSRSLQFPHIVFAGSGEPTLHRRCADFVAMATALDFPTVIYTNASRLSEPLADALVAARLSLLSISFWGANAEVAPGEHVARL